METLKYYTVYKITNKINGKIYIGYHQTDDLDDGYMGSGKIIRRAIEKYGIENFNKEYLDIFNNPEEMRGREREIVTEDFVSRGDTYNAKIGGLGGWDHIVDNESRKKGGRKAVSNMHRKVRENRLNDPEYDKKWMDQFGAMFKGQHHTEETKKKIGNANSKHQQGEGNSQYGTCWMYSVTEQKSIKVKKEEVDKYLSIGYIRGRKIKF